MTFLLAPGALVCGTRLLAAGAVIAQPLPPPFPPRLRVPGGEKPITIASLNVRVVCGPQSQRLLRKISPVRHFEWTRTSAGSSGAHSPLTKATCWAESQSFS